MMKKVMLFTLLLGALVTAAGCETVSGMAEDIANTGNNIQDIVNGGPEFSK